MSFKFRLQKVLEYREDQKKMAQEELVRCRMELQAIQQELERLEREEQRLLHFQRDRQTRSLDVMTLVSIENYRHFLQENYRLRLDELHRQEKIVEEKRRAVVESWRKCQVMEKLKGKALEKFLQEEKIAEQNVNDEISLYGYIRKGNDIFVRKGGD